MCGTTPFIMYIAMFILTWPAHFAFKEKPNGCQVLICGYLGKSSRNHRRYIGQTIILRNGVPDYTECGESKICIRGKCVAALMPHYRSRVHHVPCKRRYIVKNEPVPTRREQCQRLGFDVACIDDVRVAPTSCTNLKCGYKASDEFYLYQPTHQLYGNLHPLTGTRCGSNGVCWRNECIPLNEWLLSKPHPTYTCQENWDICREVNN